MNKYLKNLVLAAGLLTAVTPAIQAGPWGAVDQLDPQGIYTGTVLVGTALGLAISHNLFSAKKNRGASWLGYYLNSVGNSIVTLASCGAAYTGIDKITQFMNAEPGSTQAALSGLTEQAGTAIKNGVSATTEAGSNMISNAWGSLSPLTQKLTMAGAGIAALATGVYAYGKYTAYKAAQNARYEALRQRIANRRADGVLAQRAPARQGEQ